MKLELAKKIFEQREHEVVTTGELQNGDLVRHYGWLFRIEGGHVAEGIDSTRTKEDIEAAGPCLAFKAICLYDKERPNTEMPECRYGRVQGNNRAHWMRVQES